MGRIGRHLRGAIRTQTNTGLKRELEEHTGPPDSVNPVDISDLYMHLAWGDPKLYETQIKPLIGHLAPKSSHQVMVQIQDAHSFPTRRRFRAPGAVAPPWGGAVVHQGTLLLTLHSTTVMAGGRAFEAYPEAWAELQKMAEWSNLRSKITAEWQSIESTANNYLANATQLREAVSAWPALGILTRGSERVKAIQPYKRTTVDATRNQELWGKTRTGGLSQEEMTAKIISYLALNT